MIPQVYLRRKFIYLVQNNRWKYIQTKKLISHDTTRLDLIFTVFNDKCLMILSCCPMRGSIEDNFHLNPILRKFCEPKFHELYQ